MSTQVANEIPGYAIHSNGIYPEHSLIIKRTDLDYVAGGSDKVYVLVMSQDRISKSYSVQAFYGRRGNSLTPSHIFKGTEQMAAENAFDKQVKSKQKKGYKLVGDQALAEAIEQTNKEKYEGRVVWPMGAQPLKEGKKKNEIIKSDEWIAEEKEDGVRMTIHVVPTGLRMFSRNPGVDDPDRPLEKTYAFSHLKDIVFPDKYVGTIFDAEVMANGMDSATISGHINAEDGRDTSFLYLKVFDLLQEAAVDLTPLAWKYRRMKLTQTFNELQMIGLKTGKKLLFHDKDMFNAGYFRISRYTIKDKVEYHNQIIANGGEGTMWKYINSVYKEGSKPANIWYKWKKQDTADVVVLGFTDGKPGKYFGQIGAIRYGEFLTEEEIAEYKNKKKPVQHAFINGKSRYLVEIGQCSGMTDAWRKEFTENQGKYLNRVFEVEFMERTKSGAPRHPRFLHLRDDKTPEMCVHEDQR